MTKAIPRLQPRKKRQNLSGNATLVIVEGQTEENISQISPTTTETSVHSFFEDKEPILFRL